VVWAGEPPRRASSVMGLSPLAIRPEVSSQKVGVRIIKMPTAFL
jgi:hypothetical protein